MRYLTLSVLAVLIVVSTVPLVSSDVMRGESTVPNWVKNTAGWWASDQIPDSAFLQGIQYLIKEGIMIVEIPTEIDSEAAEEVPGWVKNTAGWWAEDKIHDTTFVSGIKYLIGKGILVVMEPQVEVAKCDFKGKEVVCSLTEKEVVETNDFYMEVNGGGCSYCLNWTSVGKEYSIQIETLDDRHGNYIDGVEITAKIISKGGELRYDFGQVTTEDGIYKNSITIPSVDWYAGNILSVTGEYNGFEKTIEKEFEVFAKKGGSSGCGGLPNPFDISDRDGQMTSITFNDDGTKMFLVGLDNDKVHEYKLCKNYHLGSISYTTSFSVTAKEISPHGIAFNDDGTKMFIVGQAGQGLDEYALSTAFDISSASWSTNGCTNGGAGGKYSAVDFNADGTKVMILDKQSNKVREFALSTAYDISSCGNYNSATDSTDLNSLSGVSEAKAQGMAFNDDGTKMYIVGEQHDKVYELDLSEAYDVSEETFVASFDISDQETVPTGLEFSSDGKTMFVVGKNGDEINIYNLATAWSISTAQHK